MKVFFDNGSTTRVDPRVVKAMLPYFTEHYGNASSLHAFGTKAREAVENARKVIAERIGAKPQEIIFTSGGTESDNLAIKGVTLAKGKGHIITSKFEHPAVLRTCETLEKQGFEVTYLPISSEGLVSVEALERAIKENTILVSIMHANNEVGTIQPIKEIHELCKTRGILFHTDAVQSFTKTPLSASDADLISFSSHKIHGPKGVGALYVKEGIELKTQSEGGGHEFGKRAGTENVPGIVGFAKAVEISSKADITKITKLRDYIIKRLKEISGTRINGSLAKRLCNNINVTFDRVEGESVLLFLDSKGIAVSTGSACSSKNLKPSHVLMAIGLRPEQSHGTIRITLSRENTKEQAGLLITSLKEITEKLREMNPL
jgi:cysteine desulfurase